MLDIRPATCNEEYHQKHGRLNIAKLSGVIDFDSATGVVRAAWSIQLNISFLMCSPLFSFSACHLITLYNYIQDQWDEWFNHQPTKYRNKSRHFFSLCNTIASIKLEPSTPLNSGAGLCQLSFRKSGAFSRASDNYLQVIYAIYDDIRMFFGGFWVAYPQKILRLAPRPISSSSRASCCRRGSSRQWCQRWTPSRWGAPSLGW